VIREVVPLHKPKRGERVEALEAEKKFRKKEEGKRDMEAVGNQYIFSQLYHKKFKRSLF
jgi:hypothetical protein